jgi:hypothetical protein
MRLYFLGFETLEHVWIQRLGIPGCSTSGTRRDPWANTKGKNTVFDGVLFWLQGQDLNL